MADLTSAHLGWFVPKFVASQYRLDVGGSDFFIDLLFYHLKLRCFCRRGFEGERIRAGVCRQK